MADKEKLTLKEQKFFEYYFDVSNKETYGNAAQSAMKVYNCKDEASAATIGWENLRKLDKSDIMQKSLERVGLTTPNLNGKLKELVDSDNQSVSLGATKIGYQLNGELITNKTKHSGSVMQINITPDEATAKKLANEQLAGELE